MHKKFRRRGEKSTLGFFFRSEIRIGTDFGALRSHCSCSPESTGEEAGGVAGVAGSGDARRGLAGVGRRDGGGGSRGAGARWRGLPASERCRTEEAVASGGDHGGTAAPDGEASRPRGRGGGRRRGRSGPRGPRTGPPGRRGARVGVGPPCRAVGPWRPPRRSRLCPCGAQRAALRRLRRDSASSFF